ncbi:MAG: ATP phosphoribosyltransferase [Actinobacteria bacterium]|nr:ATP phosphoribosyltransferase [Actinomycetota bacterium]
MLFLDSVNDVEFFYLRPRDIATYVASSQIDLGVTGRDLLLDSGKGADAKLELDFGHSEFRMAATTKQLDSGEISEQKIEGKRIATAYPGLVSDFLSGKGVKAEIVTLDGAVEGAIKLGVADLIIDVVATGNTIKQAGLRIFGPTILKSQALLIGRPNFSNPQVETLIRRISGVVIARQYVLVDYDIEKKNLESACEITPGLESPTISPLAKPDWVAVRAMVKRNEVHLAMDKLWAIGGRGILVTDIHSCRL